MGRQAERESEHMRLDIESFIGDVITAEDAGRTANLPYLSRMYREFYQGVVLQLQGYVSRARSGKPGKLADAVPAVELVDAGTLAVLAINTVVGEFGKGQQTSDLMLATDLARKLGGRYQREVYLRTLEKNHPDLFGMVNRELKKRGSQSEDHRMAVMRAAVKDRGGVERVPAGLATKVGVVLYNALAGAGIIDESLAGARSRTGKVRVWAPSDEFLSVRDGVLGALGVVAPTGEPMVEPPRPWTTLFDGGYHTKELRRLYGARSSGRPDAALAADAGMAPMYDCLNALQGTQWVINRWVLDHLDPLLTSHTKLEELAFINAPDLPDAPDTDDEERVKEYKAQAREAHTAQRLAVSSKQRFYSMYRQARALQDEQGLWFTYFCDSRGRMYPRAGDGVNPQGSDLQKALLQFANGKALSSAEQVRFFKSVGANRYGFDKVGLAGREAWVHEHEREIVATGLDPMNTREFWTAADSPFMFMAWCREYALWKQNPQLLVRCPAGIDGTVNGLQHLSALFRDEVGGRATNLTISPERNDLYLEVAAATLRRIQRDPDPLAQQWTTFGIERGVVKRPTMTTPYGVTRRSAVGFVVFDYLHKQQGPPFPVNERWQAAHVLMQHLWPAIGDVVRAGRDALDWLRTLPGYILPQIGGGSVIEWRTPDGFVAHQVYAARSTIEVHSRLISGRVSIPVQEIDYDVGVTSKHTAGLAPNFVHSLDACHMRMTVADLYAQGIRDFAMIHDEFGCQVADLPAMHSAVRRTFFQLYDGQDPIDLAFGQYEGLPPRPANGTLNINEILQSEFSFL